MTVHRPVVEPDLEGAFLTTDFRKLTNARPVNDVPWMQGIVENEGAIRAAGEC